MLRLLTATGLALVLLASPHTLAHALAPICGNVIKGGGCIRYVEGYDVTGTTTEVDLFFPEVASVCDCIKACYKRGSSCANFVYKFTTPSKHRSCTLYSNFNLPPSVTIGFNKTSSVDITEIGQSSLPAQAGSLVPHCTKDGSTGHDPKCISGALWALDDGKYIC